MKVPEDETWKGQEIKQKIRHFIRKWQIYTEEEWFALRFLYFLFDFTSRQSADGIISGWICKYYCWIRDAAPWWFSCCRFSWRSIITGRDRSRWQPPVNPPVPAPLHLTGAPSSHRKSPAGFLFLLHNLCSYVFLPSLRVCLNPACLLFFT